MVVVAGSDSLSALRAPDSFIMDLQVAHSMGTVCKVSRLADGHATQVRWVEGGCQGRAELGGA